MQKLVKKTLHYETIMPIEAYHPEDDTWEDGIDTALLIAGCGLALAARDVRGIAVCGAAVLNKAVHHEPTVEFVTEVIEANHWMAEQELKAEEQMFEAMVDVGKALYNGAVALGGAAFDAIVDAVEATTLANDGPPPPETGP